MCSNPTLGKSPFFPSDATFRAQAVRPGKKSSQPNNPAVADACPKWDALRHPAFSPADKPPFRLAGKGNQALFAFFTVANPALGPASLIQKALVHIVGLSRMRQAHALEFQNDMGLRSSEFEADVPFCARCLCPTLSCGSATRTTEACAWNTLNS